MKTRIKAYWDKELKRWYGISAWGLDWDEFECVNTFVDDKQIRMNGTMVIADSVKRTSRTKVHFARKSAKINIKIH